MFRLALALGRTIREVESLTDREVSEWLAYYSIEPFGETRADLRMAIHVANYMNTKRGRNQRAFRPDDFMPKFGEESSKKSDSEIAHALTLWARSTHKG